MTEPRAVVVGYDGSDEARLAAVWAAAEAASRGCPLVLVHAVWWPAVAAPLTPGPALPPVDQLDQERILREIAERQLTELARSLPGMDVRTRVEPGRAGDVLAAVGAEAELLVVGSSGRGALPRALLGSTAAELVREHPRPVVVVREAAPADGGRVVVGVDGSRTSARAIEFAYDFADRHRCELLAVHAWSDQPMDALEPVRGWEEDWDLLRTRGDELLQQWLSDYVGRFPRVTTRRVVTFDRPAHALLEHADGAALLVVGSHGRGALRRALMGSVSHAVIYHAPCPVAVLRGEPTGSRL